MRGQVTEPVAKKAYELLGIQNISTNELRLMPYIQYTMVNSQKLDISRINQEDRDILSRWRKKEWLRGGASEMEISKKFWNSISEIIFLAYVDYED